MSRHPSRKWFGPSSKNPPNRVPGHALSQQSPQASVVLDMDKKLSLPDFLKSLTSNNVPVPQAMTVASKVFKEYNTPALLAQLDDAKLQVLEVKDKDLRKLILAAIRKVGYSRPTRKPELEGVGLAHHSSTQTSAAQTVIMSKKRKRADDLNEFLPTVPADEASAYGSMDFNDVLDEQVLKVKSTVINRAPLMTAWATIVAERLGFDREEALSIGSVYTEMNAVAKGISLGIIDQSRKKDIDPVFGGQQPYVELMGRRIHLYRTKLSKWRALVDSSPAIPSTAFSYISRAFRQTTPFIVGALRLLAESYSPQELNRVGFSLYANFRPTVDGWGKRGEVRCEHILSLRKKGGGEVSDTHAWRSNHQGASEVSEEHPSKKVRTVSLEGHDTALDEGFEFDKELGMLP